MKKERERLLGVRPKVHGIEIGRVGRTIEEMGDGVGIHPTYRANVAGGLLTALLKVLEL